jgi:hypothetical protein
MCKITKVFDLINPEGVAGYSGDSKFSRFKKSDLHNFVRKNFNQTTYSQSFTKKDSIEFLYKPSKTQLIVCCIQIEITRCFISNFSPEVLECIFKSNYNYTIDLFRIYNRMHNS